MTMTTDLTSSAQASLAGALRQVMNQVLRLLEDGDTSRLLENGGNLMPALDGWRRAVETQTSSHTVQRARELEDARLEAMAKVAVFEKECADLRERNAELRAEIVRLNKREEGIKQQMFDLQFERDNNKAEAKRLDLEVRDLNRRIRELEGGPPLSPAEAAPRAQEETPAAEEPATIEEGEGSDAGEIAERLGMSSARSAVEAAFSSMWKAPEKKDEEPAEAEVAKEPAPATRKTTKKKPAKKKAADTKKAKKKTAKKKTETKKATAKKATAKKADTKKTDTKKTDTKKTSAKKATAKKATAKKATAKKATAKKTAAKKTSAKKTSKS
jgi:chemotaxis protein histidine kinase CheA